jgi:hypothetical protein
MRGFMAMGIGALSIILLRPLLPPYVSRQDNLRAEVTRLHGEGKALSDDLKLEMFRLPLFEERLFPTSLRL